MSTSDDSRAIMFRVCWEIIVIISKNLSAGKFKHQAVSADMQEGNLVL